MAILAIYDLYSKIVLEALAVSKVKLNKCRCDFMIEIFLIIKYLAHSVPGSSYCFRVPLSPNHNKCKCSYSIWRT